MRKLNLFWRSNPEWWELKNHIPVIKKDAPLEAKESYRLYLQSIEVNEYRQVKCPLCDHIYMWRQESYTGSTCDIFKRKGIDEKLESARCPKCNFEMVVVNDLLEGIDIQDENIERFPAIRGI